MKITSSAFKEGEAIPVRYTCDGEDISPPLAWHDAPKETQSFALIVDDPDARGLTWIHWILYNIDASVFELDEGVGREDVEVYTHSQGGYKARQGKNDFKKIGYGGPCPPSGRHRYYFKIFALDVMLPLAGGCLKADLVRTMKGHILAQPHLMGTYQRQYSS